MTHLLTSLFCCIVSAPPAPVDMPQLLQAIKQVESGGVCSSVGDDGKAIGPYQIHLEYWIDAVEFDPTIGGFYNDCFRERYAERVVRAYLKRYAPRNATAQDLARIHNGGPKGHKKSATKPYWLKVRGAMR